MDSLPEVVAAIIDAVRNEGDAALIRYTKEFDKVSLDRVRVELEQAEAALDNLQEEQRRALKIAAEQIRGFHTAQLAAYKLPTFENNGVSITEIERPVNRVGIYCPGGRFAYPSTVLMCAVTARVAGVKEIVLCSPPGEDGIPPRSTLAAAQLVELGEVYAVGGAQAIAAMAYGTESIKPVELIVGPGNSYVNEAKRQVFGVVGIDALAGPSEVAIVLDDPVFVEQAIAAARAQSEHGPDSVSTILSSIEVELPADINEVKCPTAESAIERANVLAPEHLEIYSRRADDLLLLVKNAGAVFVNTTAVMGDYIAGSNHVLPTGTTARFASGLRADTFMRRTSVAREGDSADLRAAGKVLADLEGLVQHSEALAIKRNI